MLLLIFLPSLVAIATLAISSNVGSTSPAQPTPVPELHEDGDGSPSTSGAPDDGDRSPTPPPADESQHDPDRHDPEARPLIPAQMLA